MIFVEKTGKTVEEAVSAAILELNIDESKVEIEIIEQSTKGFLGIGGKLAKVKVSIIEEILENNNSKKIVINSTRSETNRESRYTEAATPEDKENAQKFMRDVLNAMNIKAEIRSRITEEGLYINLSGPRMGLIIGRRGQTLDSLQYLVSLVVNKEKQRNSHIKVVLDTEDYRKKREDTLVRLATRLAEKVIRTGEYVELEPMNPYERRIIHSTLQGYDGIVTYSEGEEPNRRVIIDSDRD